MLVTVITNEFVGVTNTEGQLLLGQRVGANSALEGTNTVSLGTNTVWGVGGSNGAITVGATNQWHFYVLTNSTDPSFTNAAFVTFFGQELGDTRMGVTNVLNPDYGTRVEADIDMYVSTEAGLTNLDAGALARADKSVEQGGTEVVVYSNAVVGGTYYVGVKSEDQQAGEYGFFGVFSQLPFSENQNGTEIVRGINVPAGIPDGSPGVPQAALVMGIAVEPISVRHVVVTNVMTHERYADLFGSLNHRGQSVVLNNHTLGINPGLQQLVYEDGELAVGLGIRRSDGPGNLMDYIGTKGYGLWMLSEVDNALTHTGAVEGLWIRLEPQSLGGNGVDLTIGPNSWGYDFVDVPPEATNLTITVLNNSAQPLALGLYVRRGQLPTLTEYDYKQTINPPVGSLTIGRTDLPPLQPGRYYIGIYNPNNVSQMVHLSWTLGLSANPVQPVVYSSGGPVPILDDAVSYSTITISDPLALEIARVAVEVSITHPRISDLVLTLISPTGKRILLMENRGAWITTNVDLTFTDDTNFAQIPIKFAAPPLDGSVVMADGFENGAPGTQFAPSFFSGGWFLSAGSVDLLPNGFNGSRADTGVQYIDANGFTPGTISTNFATIPGDDYRLRFAFTRNPDGINVVTPQTAINLDGTNLFTLIGNQINSWGNLNWQHTSVVFRATSPITSLQVEGLTSTSYGIMFDSFQVGQGYFPEEPLDPLLRDQPQGTWTLEIRDDRAGNPIGTLNSWQLQFILATNTLLAANLTDGVTVTNTLQGCGRAYYTVDAPLEAHYATNILLSSTAPVSVWFDQTNPPTGTNGGDYELLNEVTSGSYTLFTNAIPALLPGARYYLGVHNDMNCATNVTFAIQVDFGADIITLTNMVPYTNSNNGTNPATDYYHFVVPTNAVRAQFEIDNPSGDMTLLVKKGLPLPDFGNFDYLSANPGLNDELIVVLTNSTPVP